MGNRNLGINGPSIAALGYGAMVLEGFYGRSNDKQGITTIVEAMNLGMMIDTADTYGNGHNEELVGQAIAQHKSKVFVATKFGIVFNKNETGTIARTNWGLSFMINGTPDYVSRAIDGSLFRLGIEKIDLLYLHFPDPEIPIEDTVSAMADTVEAGKVTHLGLSNVNADQTRRANCVHPISAVQYEYSLWHREVERELLPTLRALGISLVAWSPLGRGFLAGAQKEPITGDIRQNMPQFMGKNLVTNRSRLAPVLNLADEIGLSPAQLALSWLLHQGPDIIPIPGTRRMSHLHENLEAESFILSTGVLSQIDRLTQF